MKFPIPSDPFSVNTRANSHSKSLASLPVISHPDLDEVILLETVDSTNLELKRRRQEFRGANILIISDEQTQGKGQKGRKWESAAGLGLWMSLHLGRESSLSHNLQLLSIYSGIIVHNITVPLINGDVQLKWPNDIMIGGKKCGGILTELQWQGEKVNSAIIGIGINLSHHKHNFCDTIQNQSTSLLLEGLDNPDSLSLAHSFVHEFLENLPALGNKKRLAADWNSKAYKLNQSIIWEAGGSTFEGLFSGINVRGDALINIDGNLQAFQTGEIRISTSA